MRLGRMGSPSLERCGRRTSATASCFEPGYGYSMALVIPWLLEREYQQHRNLDYYGLPETFEEWRETASELADQLSRVTGRRVVKLVIHPGELEEWARRQGRVVSAQVRSRFAEMLWQAESAGIHYLTRWSRLPHAHFVIHSLRNSPGGSSVKLLQFAIYGARSLARR